MRLLFLCRKLSLIGRQILLEDAIGVFGIVLRFFGCALNILVDIIQISVHFFKVVFDLFLDRLLDHRSHDSQEKGFGNVEQQLVVGLLEFNVQVLDADSNVVNGHEMSTVLWLGVASCELEAETLTTKEDVHDTLVSDRWETLLLLDVVGDILEVALDAGGSDHDLVLILVADLATTKAEIVVITEFKDIGEKIVALNHQILNDGVDHRIGDFNARNGNVTGVLKDARNDDICEILDEMGLESCLAVLIVSQVEEQLLDSLAERFVLWVSIELIAKEFEFVQDAIGVVAITITEEELSLIVKSIPLFRGRVLENVTLLLEATTCELVNRLEPVLQFWVAVGISVDVVKRFEQVVSAGRVCKTLDESLEISQRFVIIAVEP